MPTSLLFHLVTALAAWTILPASLAALAFLILTVNGYFDYPKN